MKDIALSILSVGLCFYNVYHFKVIGDFDYAASFVSFIAAMIVLL